MKEILFRAKVYGGQWAYGEPHLRCEHPHIHTCAGRHFIDPKTVGQYIGINDSKGRAIYEGDVLEYYNEITKKSHISGHVVYNDHAAAFNVVNPKNGQYLYIKPTEDGIDKTLTIIGNVYDNPEYLPKIEDRYEPTNQSQR